MTVPWQVCAALLADNYQRSSLHLLYAYHLSNVYGTQQLDIEVNMFLQHAT